MLCYDFEKCNYTCLRTKGPFEQTTCVSCIVVPQACIKMSVKDLYLFGYTFMVLRSKLETDVSRDGKDRLEGFGLARHIETLKTRRLLLNY